MNVTQTPVDTIRRIEISVRPFEAKEGASLASVTGFYGTAVAPPGSALIAWQGVAGGGQQGGQAGQEEEDQQPGKPPKNQPPADEPPEPEEPPPDSDLSIPNEQ